MLCADALTLTRGERTLASDLSFTARAGEIVHVRGANGSGKTTLLRTLAGLTLPESGEVTWEGRPVHGGTAYDYRDQMIYLGHRPPLKPALSAFENLRHYRALRRREGPLDVKASLTAFGMGHLSERPCETLSAGQQRRAGLARLLGEHARLWILDEPFTALDTGGVGTLTDLIEHHVDGGGIVIITWHQDLPLERPPVRVLDLDGGGR